MGNDKKQQEEKKIEKGLGSITYPDKPLQSDQPDQSQPEQPKPNNSSNQPNKPK